jgi:hypothetical protein
MSRSKIKNLSQQPQPLPPPFRGSLAPLASTIVTGSKATVETLLGGATAIIGAWSVEAVDDAAALGPNDVTALAMAAQKITGVADPTAAQDAATKAYVDAAAAILAKLALTTHLNGASLIGIEDEDLLLTATDVEEAIFELAKYEPITLADPGTAQAIPVTRSASVDMVVGAGAETNTLAAPSFVGQRMNIVAGVVGGGSRVITVASAVNQAGNATLTFAQVKDFIALIGIKMNGVLVWRIAANDGVALS